MSEERKKAHFPFSDRAPLAENEPPVNCFRHTALALLCLLLATAVWLPSVHLVFQPRLDYFFRPSGVPPKTRAMAAYHLKLWQDPKSRAEEMKRMRASNAEWDFMGRTFLALALANMALREPSDEAACLTAIDAIIDETVRLEKENGIYFFLMDYARDGQWLAKPARSIFIDGEIALMMGARLLVKDRPDYRPALKERVDIMVRQMRQGPVLCAESYPDECWMFCNSIGLAAIRMHDVLSGEDHSAFLREWVQTAKQKLVDTRTGLLVSSFTVDGKRVMDGPEGSSIWLIAHCLQLVDPTFARDQYERARREMGRSLMGFGFAREWPVSYKGPADVDSGPIIPVLEISAGSSGLALVGASSFGDTAYLRKLITSLNLAGFPKTEKGALRYCASNQVGDAVMLYALTLGPVWKRVEAKAHRR
ncbi:MAG: hypothetical protein HY360_15650 [Verrucomicrobia bacterium]|nr:hypothetical protein [Verrucomicrobiota bacterium]